MTCKDCIHYDLCRSFSRIQLGWHGNSVHYVENMEEICKDFKDRSRFAELPCKVGDTVYFIKGGRVMSDVVSQFVIEMYDVRVRKPNGADVGHVSQFGTRIFLTREEAEQALKEGET